MKNLMDFCIGTVAFYILGCNLLCGEGIFAGWGLNPFADFAETDWSNFVFNLGWYGFNGTAAKDSLQLSQIFATTTIAPAAAICTAMIDTWIRNGKPDVSMSLSGFLADLVAITSGCVNVDAAGVFIIGAAAGVLCSMSVYFVEDKLKVDDPVGAVSVHGVCGIFGTIAVGFSDYSDGLFYGGGLHYLGIQLLGLGCIISWTAVCMFLVFLALKKTIGLRVSAWEEVEAWILQSMAWSPDIRILYPGDCIDFGFEALVWVLSTGFVFLKWKAAAEMCFFLTLLPLFLYFIASILETSDSPVQVLPLNRSYNYLRFEILHFL